MSKIRYYQFDKVSKFIDYRGKTPKKTESGIPLITAKNIKFGYLSEQPREFISYDDYDMWMTRGIPKKGDILFTTEAPLGNVCLLDTSKKRAFAQRAIIFQPLNDNIYISRYLFYYLMSPLFTKELNEKKTGTTVKGIKSSILKKFQIPFPSLQEQKRIVTKLDKLFEKIDMAIALHQKNMDEADIFMRSVLNDVFGELKEKYPFKSWNKILTIKNGKHYKNVIDEKGKYPIYGSGGIINYANQYICSENTVIIGRKGTINSPIFVKEKFWNIDTAFGIEANKEFLIPLFLYYFTIKFNFLDLNKSTTLPSLAKTNLLKINMVVPPLNIQQKIVTYLDKISKKIENLKKVQKEKMQSLVALKASILDRAFRGEL